MICLAEIQAFLPLPFLILSILYTFILSPPLLSSVSFFYFPLLILSVLTCHSLFHVAFPPSFNHSLNIPHCHSEGERAATWYRALFERACGHPGDSLSPRPSTAHSEPNRIKRISQDFLSTSRKTGGKANALYLSQNVYQYEREWTFLQCRPQYKLSARVCGCLLALRDVTAVC